MRCLSLFSGIGGIDLGFERAGIEIIAQSEVDTAACKVLSAHWPEVPNLGDITDLCVSARPDGLERLGNQHGSGTHIGRGVSPSRVDIVAGGVPCQDVSVAGKRAGLAGSRTGLFWDMARILDAIRPRWFVIEEVPGLLSSASGRDFAVILNTLADVGYEDISWRVVDSLNFGVPQRRRRVFIVGHLGAGTRSRQVLLEPEGRSWCPPTRGEARQGTAAVAAASTLQGGGKRGYRVDAEGAAGGHLVPSHAKCLTSSNERIDYETETFVAAAPTVRARDLAALGARVRRLTPTECERLQGFPDGWTEPAGSDSARYRCLGNAVTVNVAEWLGGRIMAAESMEQAA